MKLAQEALAQLFTEARTAKAFSAEAVPDARLRRIVDLVRWPPTMANSNPLRILYLRSPEARARLIPLLTEPNRPKSESAPVVAVLAVDRDFHEHLPRLYPVGAGLRDRFHGDAEGRERAARFSGAMQAGYFILAARSVGLAAGPMLGFDSGAVDVEFFAGGTWRSILVVNLGLPGEGAWRERLPRLEHDELARYA
jgi:3-hydroxypropanoate dehydrogenase